MGKFTDLPIARKLMVAFAAVIMISAASSFMVYEKIGFIQQSAGWTEHTYVVLENLDTALAAMVDQETGLRGYLLSGDDKFLDPYHKGGETYTAAFQKVKDLTSDNPVQQERLLAMNQFAQGWRTDVAGKEIALTGLQDAVFIAGDEDMVFRAVRNLDENALRHTPVGTLVEVEVGQDVVHVLDRGPGVPPEDRDLIFRRFWRKSRNNGGGAGLGLSIVSRIVASHRGAIEVSDRPGGGARFSLRFPSNRRDQNEQAG